MDRRHFLVGSLVAGGLSPLLAERAAHAAQALPEKVRGVQILVFDTFGTVVDWRTAVIAEGEKLGKEKGLKVDWAAFADALSWWGDPPVGTPSDSAGGRDPAQLLGEVEDEPSTPSSSS